MQTVRPYRQDSNWIVKESVRLRNLVIGHLTKDTTDLEEKIHAIADARGMDYNEMLAYCKRHNLR